MSSPDGTGAMAALPAVPAVPAAEPNLSQTDFLRILFRTLEQARVRYCVLQRWDTLLEELNTDHDVDLAVHPDDAHRLPSAWRALREQGYRPIQFLNHAVNSYAFIFAWSEGRLLRTVMVDVAFDHRQSGFIWRSSRELVAWRQKPGEFWVADPATEFAYLLIKKMLKGSFKSWRIQRFKVLVDRLGRFQAERIASELFGDKNKKAVVEACLTGNPGKLLSRLKKRFLLTRYLRNPFNVVRYVVEDGLRLARRWFQPTGVSLAMLGPDPVEKSALLAGVVQVLTPAFGSDKVYWFPGAAAPTNARDRQDITGQEQSAPAISISAFQLLHSFWGFCLIQVLRVRPLLVRSGLVIFDECFQERLLSARRFEAPKPGWFTRVLSRLAPRPDVLLSHDALASVRGVRGDEKLEQIVREVAQVCLDYMANRFQARHVRWAGDED